MTSAYTHSSARRFSTFLLISLLFCLFKANAATVEGVRVWRAPDHTRLVFDLSSSVNHKVFSLENPQRLVIDVEDTKFSAATHSLDLANTPVDKIRHSPRAGNDLRVVLDLKEQINPRSFVLSKQAGKPDRLVIDLYDAERETVKTVTKVRESFSDKRDIIIAIDAGHGGEDPGAVGPNRLREKDVVLAISRELERLINGRPGYSAMLIRTGDYYMPHKERRDKARKAQADLFISVHADGFKNKKARGASVFALSRRGATSETARFLAAKENEADLVGGVGLRHKEEAVAELLLDLSMKSNLAYSLEIGDQVLKEMGQIAHLHKREVEQAAFLVLKSPDVPSILVETGFISNPQEARNLKSTAFQRKMARAIFDGVENYYNRKPPAGTYIAWQKQGGGIVKYVIASGDTLSEIAKKYNVSVKQIVQANKLSSTSIRIGQTLTIPTS